MQIDNKMKRKADDALINGNNNSGGGDGNDYDDDNNNNAHISKGYCDNDERPIQVQKVPPHHPPTEFWLKIQAKMNNNMCYDCYENLQ